jgi:outer membrane immunogenic protein
MDRTKPGKNTMKKVLLGSVAVLAMATSASAADLAARPYTKAPPPVMVAMYDWSGFYIGLNGGGGWSHKCWDLNTPAGVFIANEGCHDASGGVFGGQVGYRWQSSAWVFGLEAQGDWANLRGSNLSLPLAFGPVVTNRSTIDAFGLFTGQVGYSWSNVLLYLKGGAAVAHDKYNGLFTATGIAFDGATETRWGGVVGVGLEYGFATNWSVAAEYDHMFMGSHGLNYYSVLPPVNVFSRNDTVRQDVDLFTVRVNYRFGGPVVAKY